MKVIDAVAAWLVLVLGALHSSFTHKAYPQFSLATLWFVSAGLLMTLLAALNLLRIRYGAAAPGVRAVCIAANAVTLAWAAAFPAAISVRQNPQVIASIALILLLTLLSIIRRPAHAEAGVTR